MSFWLTCLVQLKEQRLQFIRHNQTRCCQKDNIVENLILGEGGVDCSKTYLLSTFTGSKRYRNVHIGDSLAIVAHFGNHTFFVTSTTGTNWTEIQTGVIPGQSSSDRPHIVVRVYHAKMKQLTQILCNILKGGKVLYKIQVTEFQKRGLPHLHLAIKVANEPRTPEEIDEIIRAEMPTDDAELLELVKKFMIHEHYSDRCFRTENQKKHKM